MEISRKHGPGRYGVEPVFLFSAPIGGANKIGGASPLTANATTTFRLGGFHRKVVFLRFSASQATLVADADGTVVARMRKVQTDGSTVRTLSADINLEAGTALVSQKADPLSTATAAHRTILPGETLFVDVVNNSAAIDTQPVDLILVGEFAVID